MTNAEIVALLDKVGDLLIYTKGVLESQQRKIAELHQEIQYRDNRIQELEGQLIIKSGIINKQAVMLAGDSNED